MDKLTEAFTDHNEDGVFTPQQRDNCSDPRFADDLCLAGFEEFYYDFNNNGQFDLNDTPRPFSNSSVPDGLYNGVLCRSEDEASGVCSRDLVQLSQNLEIILSPGEQGYDLLVVDRNRQEARNTLYGGNTYQLYVADLYNNPLRASPTLPSLAGVAARLSMRSLRCLCPAAMSPVPMV